MPFSVTTPFWNTNIVSQFLIVDNLCAIIIHVLPCCALSNASWTIFSDSVSNADVASSNNNIFGFLINALAMAILCFWPPDNWPPLSPTNVWYF